MSFAACGEAKDIELATTMLGLGRLPNKRFCRPLRGAKIASVATLALLAVSALPPALSFRALLSKLEVDTLAKDAEKPLAKNR